MIGQLFTGLADRIGSFWTLDDPEERIRGSGEEHLEPAEMGRYAAKRRLKEFSNAQEAAQQGADDRPGGPDHPRP